jgi:hypothetical protein
MTLTECYVGTQVVGQAEGPTRTRIFTRSSPCTWYAKQNSTVYGLFTSHLLLILRYSIQLHRLVADHQQLFSEHVALAER